MILTRLTALLCSIAICAMATAQTKQAKVKFGDITSEDFKPEYYDVDSSADAVYLYDVGSAKHEGNRTGWFSAIYKVHKCIRLLYKKGFDDLATIKISLSKWDDGYERFDKLQAVTYTIE